MSSDDSYEDDGGDDENDEDYSLDDDSQEYEEKLETLADQAYDETGAEDEDDDSEDSGLNMVPTKRDLDKEIRQAERANAAEEKEEEADDLQPVKKNTKRPKPSATEEDVEMVDLSTPHAAIEAMARIRAPLPSRLMRSQPHLYQTRSQDNDTTFAYLWQSSGEMDPMAPPLNDMERDHVEFMKTHAAVLNPEGAFALTNVLKEIRKLSVLGSLAAHEPALVLISHIRYRYRFTQWVRLMIQYNEELLGPGVKLPKTEYQMEALYHAMAEVRKFFIWIGRDEEVAQMSRAERKTHGI